MRYVSLGDLAQTFQLRRQTVEVQRNLQRLTDEMATGRKADTGRAVSGDHSGLAGIERALVRIDAFRLAADEAGLLVTAGQTVLGQIQDAMGTIGPTLLSGTTTAGAAQIDAATADGKAKFDAVLAALNTQVAGRYIFSGIDSGTRPVAEAADILASLRLAVAGEVTVSGVASAVDDWFDAPAGGGGFLDTAYAGSATALAPFRIGQNDMAGFAVTAADPALRDALKGLAMAALVSDGTFAGDTAARAQLTRLAGERITGAEGGVTALRAGVGTSEARIAEAEARNAGESTALTIARGRILDADPYETATALDAAQGDLERLYTITARLSRLSFADYLR